MSGSLESIFYKEKYDDVTLEGWALYCNDLYFFRHSEDLHPWQWQPDYPEELAIRQLYREEDLNILKGISRLKAKKIFEDMKTREEKRKEDQKEAERKAQAAETERLKREAGIGPYKYLKR